MLKFLNLDKKKEAKQKALSDFTKFNEVYNTDGWKTYAEAIDKKKEYGVNQFKDNISLTGEDLKRLQLAYQVYKEVERIPRELKEKAGGK